MERIRSIVEKERSEKRKKLWLGAFFIAILVLSTLGFALTGVYNSSNTQTDNQNGDGQYNGQYWVYNLGGQEFYFNNDINDINFENVELDKRLNSYSGKKLFIDSENEVVSNLLAGNLGRFAERVQEACYGECERDLPEKDCSENLIIWRESEEKKVFEEQNCVFIYGDLSMLDAFLYRVLGFN